jgi:hypothetical protein
MRGGVCRHIERIVAVAKILMEIAFRNALIKKMKKPENQWPGSG